MSEDITAHDLNKPLPYNVRRKLEKEEAQQPEKKKRQKAPRGISKKDPDGVIAELLKCGAQKFFEELMALEGRAFVDRYLSLVEYQVPKLSRQEVKGDVGHHFQITLMPLTDNSKQIESNDPPQLETDEAEVIDE